MPPGPLHAALSQLASAGTCPLLCTPRRMLHASLVAALLCRSREDGADKDGFHCQQPWRARGSRCPPAVHPRVRPDAASVPGRGWGGRAGRHAPVHVPLCPPLSADGRGLTRHMSTPATLQRLGAQRARPAHPPLRRHLDAPGRCVPPAIGHAMPPLVCGSLAAFLLISKSGHDDGWYAHRHASPVSRQPCRMRRQDRRLLPALLRCQHCAAHRPARPAGEPAGWRAGAMRVSSMGVAQCLCCLRVPAFQALASPTPPCRPPALQSNMAVEAAAEAALSRVMLGAAMLERLQSRRNKVRARPGLHGGSPLEILCRVPRLGLAPGFAAALAAGWPRRLGCVRCQPLPPCNLLQGGPCPQEDVLGLVLQRLLQLSPPQQLLAELEVSLPAVGLQRCSRCLLLSAAACKRAHSNHCSCLRLTQLPLYRCHRRKLVRARSLACEPWLEGCWTWRGGGPNQRPRRRRSAPPPGRRRCSCALRTCWRRRCAGCPQGRASTWTG